MQTNPELEERVKQLIKVIDSTRISRDGSTVHKGESGYSQNLRSREPFQLSIAKATRKTFFRDDATKALKSDDELYSLDNEAYVYFTRIRKEKGAVWLDLFKAGLASYFGGGFFESSRSLHTETDFIDHFVSDVILNGKKLGKDKIIQIGDLLPKSYSAKQLAMEWGKLSNGLPLGTNFNYLKNMHTEGEEITYLMHSLYRPYFKQDQNVPIMIFGRVKHSDSANIKQSEVWAEELDICDRLKPFFAGIGAPGYMKSKSLADTLDYKPPESSAFVRQYKSKHGKDKNPTRLDELRENWRYDIEDIFGITIVLSREFDYSFVENLKDHLNSQNSLFLYEPNSDDDHTKNKNKPNEYQFKVRVNQTLLEKKLGVKAKEISMPDTIEVMVTSAPDLVHKQLAPYLAERAYKRRKQTDRLKEPGAQRYFKKLYDVLTSISPVQNTIFDEGKHVALIRENLQNGTTFTYEHQAFSQLDPYRTDLFPKKHIFF